MKVFSTALILNAAAAATTANDGAADALRSPSLVTADLVYVATDADASSNQNDVIENQADAADEVSAHFLVAVLTWEYYLSYILLSVFLFPLD